MKPILSIPHDWSIDEFYSLDSVGPKIVRQQFSFHATASFVSDFSLLPCNWSRTDIAAMLYFVRSS